MCHRRLRTWWVCAMLLGTACAPTVQKLPDEPARPPESAAQRAVEPSLFSSPDTDLFHSALSHLRAQAAGQAAPPDYDKGRKDLEELLKAYPKSRWRGASEELILLIDQITAYRRLMEQSSIEKKRLTEDNALLKRETRMLHERLQAEINGLAQENEQLKKDIQTLKNLEIELEKRDRKLR